MEIDAQCFFVFRDLCSNFKRGVRLVVLPN